ncbi:AbrB/MazE/SpoVT family DNA-binding domain-containing protein [uncultured Deinococcus sp.]|uniref:AbrB/MazE/SpoVT family DNA-binding domain-containing protein n=1 Tax=uncultured Deinococcus sp. TaxID=158789 RepID=UPI0025CF8CD3|nr:AbrB/MazE/SpoVT family DNA-binding domain-containing protein [uncultured Deinococcus sp.]
MRKKLTSIGKSRALIIPKELLELYGFSEEIEIEPVDGGLILRPARTGLSFAEAKAKLFAEKRDLLARLSDA